MTLPDDIGRSSLMRRAWSSIGFICATLALAFCVFHAFDPPRLNWGDSLSDYNVMTAGRNFWKYGFVRLRFTPFLLDPALMTDRDAAFIYTHYPQLPDVMNGVLRTVLGMTDIVQFRLVALALSFGSLFFIYKLIRSYWSQRVAQVALALWVMNSLWIQHADYLHHGPYGSFFGYGSLYFLVRYLREGERRRFLFAAGSFLFITFLSSYDYWFYAPILIVLVAGAHYGVSRRGPLIKTVGVMGAFALAAVTVKLATNAWVLGGVAPMIRDLYFQYVERATDKVARSTYEGGIWPTMYGRVERFFTLLLFPLVLASAALPFVRRQWTAARDRLSHAGPNPGVLLLAALPFLYLFREIWMGQYYPGLLVLPFYAVAFGVTIELLLDTPRAAVRAIAPALLMLLLGNSAFGVLSFKKAFLRREVIRTLGAQLDSVSRRGQQVLANHIFNTTYRYYFDRNANAMILIAPKALDATLAALSDPQVDPRSGTADGAIFVQDKHLSSELFDKGYYYLLGRYGLWTYWGNPPKYRPEIDALVALRDSVLMDHVARIGTKLYDTDDYAIWRIKPAAVSHRQ
jgi:hypothetical protein